MLKPLVLRVLQQLEVLLLVIVTQRLDPFPPKLLLELLIVADLVIVPLFHLPAVLA